MPIIGIPSFGAMVPAPCTSTGAIFTLADFINAWDEANDTDQTAVSHRVITGEATVNAFNVMDLSQLKAVGHRLGAITEHNPEDVPSFVDVLLDNVEVAGLVDNAIKWVGKVFNFFDWHVSVGFSTSGPCSGRFVFSPPKTITLELTLTPDCTNGGSGAVDAVRYNLQVPTCEHESFDEIQIATLTTPGDAPGQVFYEATAFQIIINLLSKLLVCCNPCSESTWVTGPNLRDTTQLRPSLPLSKLEVNITRNPDPARIDWQPPIATLVDGVQRFGKFVFIYENGDAGDVRFINYAHQLFEPALPGCLGADIFLNPGVEGVANYKTKEPYPGDAFTPP